MRHARAAERRPMPARPIGQLAGWHIRCLYACGRRTTYALRDLAGVHGPGLTLWRLTGRYAVATAVGRRCAFPCSTGSRRRDLEQVATAALRVPLQRLE